MMEAFGGFYVEDPKNPRAAQDAALAFPGPALVNVLCATQLAASASSSTGIPPQRSGDLGANGGNVCPRLGFANRHPLG